jgi:hypothetical protein
MVQLSATRCSYIAILRVSLVNFATITLCVASQRVIPKVSVYFVMDSVRKLLATWGSWFTHHLGRNKQLKKQNTGFGAKRRQIRRWEDVMQMDVKNRNFLNVNWLRSESSKSILLYQFWTCLFYYQIIYYDNLIRKFVYVHKLWGSQWNVARWVS